MVDAAVETVPVDHGEARRRLTQAMKHAQSADRCVDNESAFILLYAGVHKALTAVLLSVGLRVGAGERAHAMLIREVKNHFGTEHAQLLTRIDRARRKRNDVAYETQAVATAELAAMKNDTKKTLEQSLRFVRAQTAAGSEQ